MQHSGGKEAERKRKKRKKKTFSNTTQPVCSGICIWQQNLGPIPVQEIPVNVPETDLAFKARGAHGVRNANTGFQKSETF